MTLRKTLTVWLIMTAAHLSAQDRLRPITLNLIAEPRTVQILPGDSTSVWSYTGSSEGGGRQSLGFLPNSYLGPTISAMQGQQIKIKLTNQLDQPTVTHWHGLDVPADMDGHPAYAFPTGESYSYSFTISNRAGTYWYHPHPDMATADQVQMGLTGFFIVHDRNELALNLPSGAADIPLCIQDRAFDSANQFVFNPSMMHGFFGSLVCVNGKPNYVQNVGSRVHRLRLLNGSTSRIYKLAFSDGTPMVIIGNDGGLLATPNTKPYLMLSPGERAEVWADFRGKPLNSEIILQSLSFSGAGMNQGAALDVMTFKIVQQVTDNRSLPANLSSIPAYNLWEAVNASNPKSYPITQANGHYVINGASFSMEYVATNEIARCGTLEVISVSNPQGMMHIAHPIHFHGRQFQILDRTVVPSSVANWNTVKDGYNDSGWKDTFMLMPGETVRILVRHGKNPGLFNYHCHNLVHEDMGMMRNFRLNP